MPYLRRERPHYESNRPSRQTLRRHGLASMGSPAVSSAVPSSDYMAANITDVSNFLARYLTGKERVLVQPYPEGEFATFKKDYAGHPYDIIVAPEWKSYGLKLPGFDKYRIYRSGVWHETDHVNYSPEALYKFGSNSTEKFMVNILEDRRVEDIGVQKWPGYVPERIHTQAYFYSVRPDVSTLYDPNEPADSQKNKQARIEAFLQRMLLGKVKGQLPPDQMKTVEDAAKFAEQKLEPLSKERVNEGKIMTDMEALTLEAIRQLDVAPTKDADGKSSDENMNMPDYEQTRDENAAKGKSQSDIEKGMEEFFGEKKKELGGGNGDGEGEKGEQEGEGSGAGEGEEGEQDGQSGEGKEGKEEKKDTFGFSKKDLDKAQQGSSDAKAEYTNIMGAGGGTVDPALVEWQPAVNYGPTAPYRDSNFMNHMKTELEKWIKGYDEIRGSSGSRFKVKQWIRDPDQAFVTRLRKSVKGNKVLVLVDLSGSTRSFSDEYKRAVINGLETLDKVGVKTGLFTFNSDQFVQVKRFEDPRWTNVHASKMAALDSGGGTPTGVAYEKLGNYVKRHRPDAFVTMTDGSPNNPDQTKGEVAKLKRNTRMVAFGIAGGGGYPELTARIHTAMEGSLKEFNYNKSFVVDNVSEIPKKLVKTIIGE